MPRLVYDCTDVIRVLNSAARNPRFQDKFIHTPEQYSNYPTIKYNHKGRWVGDIQQMHIYWVKKPSYMGSSKRKCDTHFSNLAADDILFSEFKDRENTAGDKWRREGLVL